MEIFESLFEKLAVYKVTSFKNGLYSVSRSYCLMSLRKTETYLRLKSRMNDAVQTEQVESNPGACSVEQIECTDGEKLVLAAVETLNHEQKACIRLMYFENKSYRDISDITGFAPNQVKSHIQNGKRNLKNYLLSRHDYPLF
jgi:RNA polymerase sigma-70 factor (ECF subfamily)